jgi:thiol-disulfide isomerase/thioredoxin
MAWLVLSSVLLGIFILALSLVTFSLARQIGVLHERTQPVASELRTRPVDEGAILEKLDVPAHHSVETVSLLFVTTSCPVCRMLHPTFSKTNKNGGALAAYWVFARDTLEAVTAYAVEHAIPTASQLVKPSLADQCAVTSAPTLVGLRRDGQGWRLLVRQTIVSSQQLQTLLDGYGLNADAVGADYRLGVRA